MKDCKSYNDVWQYLASGCIRYCGKSNVGAIVITYIRCHAFRDTFWMRLASYNGYIQLIARLFRKHYSVKYG